VTILLRLLSSLASLRSVSAQPRTLAAALAAGISALFLLVPAPAGAVVTKVEASVGQFTEVGLQPRNMTSVLDGGLGASFSNPNGNPVLHSSDSYVIYWEPGLPEKARRYHNEWESLVEDFLQAVGTESGSLGNVFAVDTQYTDKSNQPASYKSTFRGAYEDDTHYPSPVCTSPGVADTCLTNAQVQEQLKSFISTHGLPKGMGTIYYVLLPPGVTLCVDGAATHCSDYSGLAEETNPSYADSFCSYHSAINPDNTPSGDENTILYAAIPWIAGGLGSHGVISETAAYDCQDGGFNPAAKHPEEKEHAKEKNKSEEEAFEKADGEEKAQTEEREKLEEPHQEEPNQTSGTGDDGANDAGLADLIINQIAVEQQNIVTNPLLNAWQGQAGAGEHLESTDECRNFFAGGTPSGSVTASEETGAGTLSNQLIASHSYYLNLAFNLAASKLGGAPCIGGVRLDPNFTAPNPVSAGVVVGFDGEESDISLAAGVDFSASGALQENYATYTWNFGDGTPEVTGYAPGAPLCETPWLSPCAASVFHAYQYGGTYEVTLTVRDIGGNVSSVTHSVTVVGPSRPVSGSGQGSGSSTGTTTPGTGSSTGVPGPIPAPVAAASIVPQSLRTALRKGLVVSYSVNEQVAGHFEVLLGRATAHRLGISGAAAVGLPAGSPAEIVIAKAILVTTKGGHSAIHILFSKHTAARLAHAHKVSLMLRLIVRNAASSDPATTTVISSVTLNG
jgi:PKD domain